MIIVLVFGFMAVYSLIRYIKLPKPPNGLNYRELYNYYDRDWKEYNEQQRLENERYSLELEEIEQQKLKLYKEIDFLTAQIDMLEDLERLIEKDIHNGTGSEKVNLSRLISIDKQIHTAQQKIDKLKDKLEDL
jgi:hypothetical protein